MDDNGNKLPELNTDAIFSILSKMEFGNLMEARCLSKSTNALIMTHRSSLPRIEIKSIFLINSTHGWDFSIRKGGDSFLITDQEDVKTLLHFKPITLNFFNGYVGKECLYSDPLKHFPEPWFKDVKNIYLSQPKKVTIDDKILRKFTNLEELVIKYNSPYEKLSDVVSLMHDVRCLRIFLSEGGEETKMSCTDADLIEITKKSKKLTHLILDGPNCENTWKTSTFLEFMAKASFGEKVMIKVEKWFDDIEKFNFWLNVYTKVGAKSYEGKESGSSERFVNYYHNSFRFFYRSSQFELDIKELTRNG